MPSIVTANRLRDGVVVFLTANGSWSEDISEARVAADKSETATLEADGQISLDDQSVVSLYPMDVAIEGGKPRPISVREKIRAAHDITF